MKIAICTFAYDEVAKKFESEWIVTGNEVKEGVQNIYVSSSPQVVNKAVKYASGKYINDLWKEHVDYLKQNNKLN